VNRISGGGLLGEKKLKTKTEPVVKDRFNKRSGSPRVGEKNGGKKNKGKMA